MVSRRTLLPVAAAVIALAAPAGAQAHGCRGADATPSARTAKLVRSATVCLINAERRRHGLRPLRADRSLTTMAKGFARRMVREHFFDHTAPGGATLERRALHTAFAGGANIQSYSIGEDLGWATGALATPRGQVASWMASPPHRENILEPSFRDIGVGFATGVPVSGFAAGAGATYAAEFGVHRQF